MINPCYKFALTKDPVYATRGIRDSRFVKVLDLMLYGCPITLDNTVYELVETGYGGFMPIAIINEKERLIQGMHDMTLQDFSELVAEMPNGEFDAWYEMHNSSRKMWDNISTTAKKRSEDAII